MSKEFVAYLNTLHNEQASNQNAIAEAQISNPLFAVTQVKRNLIGFLTKKIRSGQTRFIVLTGHAGDGKTTLLFQVLSELGALSQGQTLQEADTVTCSDGCQIYYIKDFSELTKEEQIAQLESCLQNAKDGICSLLVANTGPLLTCFCNRFGETMESTLISAMDSSVGEDIALQEDVTCFVLNIARIDNTDFIKPFLRNLTVQEQWQDCEICRMHESCPIELNQRMLLEHGERVQRFITRFYIWMQEYDNRATIRQITAHLAYMITGGLSCERVHSSCKPDWRYCYMAPNLFFGHIGTSQSPSAQQVKGVRLVTEARMDERQTSLDYELYVKQDLHSYFPQKLSQYIETILKKRTSVMDTNIQNALKRIFLFFGQSDATTEKQFTACVFSEWFEYYLRLRKGEWNPDEKMKRSIYCALSTLFVGECLEESPSHIYLTLKRSTEQTYNVQLLSGRINVDDLQIVREEKKALSAEYSKQYGLFLRYKDKVHFEISLPLLNYFAEIKNGMLLTDIDPLLSNGIDSLKAQLLAACQKTTGDHEATVLYLDGLKWRVRTLSEYDGRIEHA